MQAVKNVVKTMAEKSGYEIHKLSVPEENKFKWLEDFKVHTILDIGANSGQFGLMIKRFFPQATVYSFEPLGDVYRELTANLKRAQSEDGAFSWRAFNIALGDFNGTSKIQRSKVSTDSSLLGMTEFYKETHAQYATESKAIWEEDISVKRLDDFFKEESLDLKAELMIKMDTEGYEAKVIDGGTETLKKAKIVFTEVTFHNERYQGQILFDELYNRLKDLGYRCYGFYHMAYKFESGMPTYADAVFVRE
jgi:FkbM family methyltransferase